MKRPNIILIIADDLSWEDLPFFSPPAPWGAGLNLDRPDDSDLDPRRVMRPTLNRLEARFFAERELDADGSPNPDAGELGTSPLLLPALAPDQGFVFPLEFSNFVPSDPDAAYIRDAAEDLSCKGPGNGPCDESDYSRDVLRGFGGGARR